MTTVNSKLMTLSTSPDHLFFGDSGHGISRYDKVRYPILEKLNERMKSLYWHPKEIDMSQERRSFERMTEAEQFVFTSNLKRQILLDSIQGRAPALTFLEHCTDPMLENCILTWSFFESIHSESYTYPLRAIYPDPAVVIDDMANITEIVDCAKDISAAYEAFRECPNKDNLYLALVAANALEALRFYVSFACTFSLLERGMVEGSAKIIRLISRDEAVHLSLVQHVIKLLPQDDPEFADVIARNQDKAVAIFEQAAAQEKQWAKYLFQKGTIMGLNEDILCRYVDYLLQKRMKAIGLPASHERIDHPIPWVEKYFSTAATQTAPQEAEVGIYLTSSIENDAVGASFDNYGALISSMHPAFSTLN